MRHNLQYVILGGGINLSQAWSGVEPQSQTVFEKYLIEYSSFSSTVYYTMSESLNKILNKLMIVAILFLFQ